MKVLSIRQPWLAFMLDLPSDLRKRIENRTWNTAYRGPLLLHASKTCTRQDYEDACDFAVGHVGVPAIELPHLEQCKRGGIVARARLVDVIEPCGMGRADGGVRVEHELDEDPWYTGEYGFVLDEVAPVDFIPCPGALGLFRPPKHVREAFGVP